MQDYISLLKDFAYIVSKMHHRDCSEISINITSRIQLRVIHIKKFEKGVIFVILKNVKSHFNFELA